MNGVSILKVVERVAKYAEVRLLTIPLEVIIVSTPLTCSFIHHPDMCLILMDGVGSDAIKCHLSPNFSLLTSEGRLRPLII